MSLLIYPSKLEIKLRLNTKYIPRKLNKNENLILYNRYWIEGSDDIFKLTTIDNHYGITYYFLEGRETNYVITYPPTDTIYAIEINNTDLLQTDIINNETQYRGCDIKYWFYKKWDIKYKDFKKYIIMNSNKTINDNKKYYVTSTIIDNKYRNCKLISPK